MNVLLVAATEGEIEGITLKEIEALTPHTIEVLITGVGIASTTYFLTKKLSESKFDLAINIGVGGSYNGYIKTGDVVHITQDCFADLGAEDDEAFLPVHDLGLLDKNSFPFKDGWLTPGAYAPDSLRTFKKVKGITVNKVHGNSKSIEQAKSLFNPDVESMEGAAFFYVCMMENSPCLQIRAISNRVEKRNREVWNIPSALASLSDAVNKLLMDLP